MDTLRTADVGSCNAFVAVTGSDEDNLVACQIAKREFGVDRTVARAIENQAYVLGVNRTGDDPRLHYSGDSAVIGCKGETLAEAGEGQRLLTARLDMDELRRFREKFPAWRDADDFDLK